MWLNIRTPYTLRELVSSQFHLWAIPKMRFLLRLACFSKEPLERENLLHFLCHWCWWPHSSWFSPSLLTRSVFKDCLWLSNFRRSLAHRRSAVVNRIFLSAYENTPKIVFFSPSNCPQWPVFVPLSSSSHRWSLASLPNHHLFNTCSIACRYNLFMLVICMLLFRHKTLCRWNSFEMTRQMSSLIDEEK